MKRDLKVFIDKLHDLVVALNVVHPPHQVSTDSVNEYTH